MNKCTRGIITGAVLMAISLGVGVLGGRIWRGVNEVERKKAEAYRIFRKAEKHFDSNRNLILESGEVARMAARLGYDGVFPETPLQSVFEYCGDNKGYLTILGGGYPPKIIFPISRLEEAIREPE